MHRRHLESVSAALYGRCFCIVRIQPQLSGKGVLGHSPKRILVPFVRIKGTPRRRAAQTLHPAKSTRRRQATTNLAPAGQAYSLCLCKRLRAATSLPLAQGSLWLGVASTTLSSKSRPGGRQEGRYCRSARYCSSRASSWAAVSARMALGSAARSSAGVRLPQVISTVGRPRFLPREISTWESPT